MRYEAKHNYFKKLAQKLGNFVNLSWTLAMRHQQWSCYQWLDTKEIGGEIPEYGPGERSQIHVYMCSKLLVLTTCYHT